MFSYGADGVYKLKYKFSKYGFEKHIKLYSFTLKHIVHVNIECVLIQEESNDKMKQAIIMIL